jgi:hypothetical protein
MVTLLIPTPIDSCIRVSGNQDAGYQGTRISAENKKEKISDPDILIP